MLLIERINNDITQAMKSQDKFTLSVLRMLKSALQNEKIAQNKELEDSEIIAVIKKQVKVRKESKLEYEKYSRIDLSENLEREIVILTRYLPEELSKEEINKIIDQVIKKVKPTSIKDMGGIMKELTPLLASKADMSLVSSIVKEILSK